MPDGLTLAEVLRLEAFAGVRLVSDCPTDTAIRTANVMEVPDVVQWVRPGELLMTTLYALRADAPAQAELIPQLAARKVGALAVKPRRFVLSIPAAMIEAANRHAFPLLELPADAYFSRLSEALVRELALRELARRQADDFVRDWLLGRIEGESELQWRARRAGRTLGPAYRAVYCALPPDSGPEAAAVVERDLERLFGGRSGHLIGPFQHGVVLLCPAGGERNAPREAWASLQALPEARGLRIGVGGSHAGVMNVPRGAAEARQAVEVAETLQLREPIVHFEDLGLLCVLHSMASQPDAQSFAADVLQPLLDYDRQHRSDLTETLRTFFLRNGNARAVSSDLFMHYHTVLYRLERIQAVTGMDLDDPDDRLSLQLALRLRRFVGGNNAGAGPVGAAATT